MKLSTLHRPGRQRARADLILAALLGLLLAAGIAFVMATSRQSEPVAATVLPEPLALPSFQLRDGSGAAFARDDFKGRDSLLFFGFTHCPDVCPLTLQQLAAARRQLIADGESRPPHIVFVSVDPERDTPEQVAQYISAFGEGITGAVGELEELNKLTSALGVFHARLPAEDGYEVEHSAAVLYIDAEARLGAVFSAPHTVDELVTDWPALVGAT